MPTPPLPLEVASLIAEELRLSYAHEKDLRADGMSVSLVCKAWQPLGERIAWYTLVVDSSKKAHWAKERFEEVPRLARFVRAVAIPRKVPSSAAEALAGEAPVEEWDELGEAEANVSELLKVCELANVLLLEEPPWLDLEVLLEFFPPLPNLLAFHFETRVEDFMRGALLLQSIAAMPQLVKVTLRMPDSIDYDNDTPPPPIPPVLLPVEEAFVRCSHWQHSSTAASRTRLSRHLLSLVDPSTVRNLELHLDCDQFSLLDAAFSFPHLLHLTLIFQRGDPQPAIDHVLHLVQQHGGRLQMHAGICNLDGNPRPIKLFGTDDLRTILDMLPDNLAVLALGGLHITAPALPPQFSNLAQFVSSQALSIGVRVGEEEGERDMHTFAKMDDVWYFLFKQPQV